MAAFGSWMMKKPRRCSVTANLIMLAQTFAFSLLCAQPSLPRVPQQPHVIVMDPHRERRTLREEDLDWIASRISLLQMQINGLAEGLEALQQAFSKLADRVHGLEERVPRNAAARRKCHKIVRVTLESLETMDE